MAKLPRAADLRAILSSLERLYGAKRKLKQGSLLHQAVLGTLLIGTTTAKALRALKVLQNEFIDWNEVRVCTPTELAETLQPCGVPAVAAVAARQLFWSLFEQTSALTLDFLEKEKAERAYEWLLSLRGVPPQAAAEVAMAWFNVSFLPVDEELLRIVRRLGLADHEAPAVAARRGMERLLRRSDYYRFYRLFTDHAALVCTPEEYDSEHCVLLEFCEAGQKHVLEIQQQRLEAEKAAQAAACVAQLAAERAQRKLAAASAARGASSHLPRATGSAPAAAPSPRPAAAAPAQGARPKQPARRAARKAPRGLSKRANKTAAPKSRPPPATARAVHKAANSRR